jgi:hypothetical protein
MAGLAGEAAVAHLHGWLVHRGHPVYWPQLLPVAGGLLAAAAAVDRLRQPPGALGRALPTLLWTMAALGLVGLGLHLEASLSRLPKAHFTASGLLAGPPAAAPALLTVLSLLSWASLQPPEDPRRRRGQRQWFALALALTGIAALVDHLRLGLAPLPVTLLAPAACLGAAAAAWGAPPAPRPWLWLGLAAVGLLGLGFHLGRGLHLTWGVVEGPPLAAPLGLVGLAVWGLLWCDRLPG